jgi:hypothetical protein
MYNNIMSNVKKPAKSTKVVKAVKVEKIKSAPIVSEEESPQKPEPKKRASRAKKQPTKEEVLQQLMEASNGLKKLIQDLKEDEMKFNSSGLSLKCISELVTGELQNLDEEQKEVDEKYQAVLALPDEVKSQ